MKRIYDAIIIGAGVNGSSIAFNLVKRGKKVAVLERGRIAGKSSGAAAGILGAQAELTEDGPLFQLARISRTMFPDIVGELEELSGIHIGYQNKGLFKVATNEQQVAELKSLIQIQTRAGEEPLGFLAKSYGSWNRAYLIKSLVPCTFRKMDRFRLLS